MSPTKVMNHSEYQRKIKGYTGDSLRHIIKQCQEVIELQKDFNPNCGYYQDEIHYCNAELKRREGLKNPNNKYAIEKQINSIIESVVMEDNPDSIIGALLDLKIKYSQNKPCI